ncbi:3-ketodihydrosphingosine reductase precursor, putative [Entamoeba invadens IP1]|uniref:3-dehydrosphinganine reductase n=1 Tax=Entamoeba invadens IP1 TaxID=370355 RepID=A0A0A1UEN1_ENTIV|nr:3-ketodihydrosphingosine reductase precursor, putative [Entamoeba invadens IP1]ELP94948.1 3-ketodihydrosphingosine reductase precursor, putative [Entamoeba invadens IP1]|eukprot:XP_004261719.1 3-ketodihydrosphingosine reductase precursor, putative [Entamoeba invadens IP1]
MSLFSFPLIFLTLPIGVIIVCALALIITYAIGGLCYLYFMYTFTRKDRDFSGKHIFIYGGSAGVGKALALRLAKQGVHLSIAARTDKALKEVQEECQKQNPVTTCDYYICDMTKTENVSDALKTSISKFGFPRLLINTAGIAHPGFLEDVSYETYQKDMDLNYFGNLRMMKESQKLYNESKTNSDVDIVCVGSCLGLIGSIGYTAYCPSKYAVKGLVDSLRFEFLGTKMHLHYYGPSNMDTPGFAIENKNKPKLVQQMEDNVKTITADEAAHNLLCNLDKYVITSEPDLELMKNSATFMSSAHVSDILSAPLAIMAITFYRWSIENNILKNKKNKSE